MKDLQISRRTLQRWLDDLDVNSLEFEDQLRVFLTLPQMQRLREYGEFMKSRNQSLIERYRDAYATGNARRISRLVRELEDFKLSKSLKKKNRSLDYEPEPESDE